MTPLEDLLLDEYDALDVPRPGRIVLLDLPGMVDAAAARTDDVVVWCDDLRDLAGVDPSLVATRLDADAFTGADAVWMRLPKSLAALDEYAELTADHASSDVRLVASGRIKDMTFSMNEVLASHFGHVSASRGRGKARVLRAWIPFIADATWPRRKAHADLGVDLVAHGHVFAGTKVDPGTRLLLDHLKEIGTGDVHDLGCGNGVIAVMLARHQSGKSRVSASDVSASAVASTRESASANRVKVDVSWADGLTQLADASLDVIVTNPPFHTGIAKDSDPTLAMFEDASRVLRKGGELWCVYNSHLPWRGALNASVGPTRVVAQNPKYTLTRTIAR
ncbi:MAG TPA: class I SAM-dependent methyltransferase [Propionibacteriaceae bacterium]|nr:class I SAM-dependent methyltransferase [Propionibacteriaceae bacterium]